MLFQVGFWMLPAPVVVLVPPTVAVTRLPPVELMDQAVVALSPWPMMTPLDPAASRAVRTSTVNSWPAAHTDVSAAGAPKVTEELPAKRSDAWMATLPLTVAAG